MVLTDHIFNTGVEEFCVSGMGDFPVVVTRCVEFDGVDAPPLFILIHGIELLIPP
jgi:hypothetical protein